MPDSKVSALPAAATLTGAELLPVVQGGVSERTTVDDARALTPDYTDTSPLPPVTGLRLFSRLRARRLVVMVGPSGQDTALQPALFANRVARWNAVNNSTTVSLDGLAVSNIANPTAVANNGSSYYTSMVRARFASAATTPAAAGTRSSSAQWFMSTTPNIGGFFFVCRFGLNLVTATNRGFIGLSTTTGALSSSAEPSALLNMIGFGWDSNQTTLRFLCNDGAGVASSVDLGANFPVNRNATDFYEVRMFCPSGAGATVNYSAQRLNDGAMAQGSVNADLPALGVMMSAHVHHANGTTAAIVNLDMQSLYVETDN